jgi:hypothetical protein
LAWLTAWGLFFMLRRLGSRPQPISEQPPQKADIVNSDSDEDHFPAPWTVETITDGFRVVDANGQSLAYVYSRKKLNDAQSGKVLTEAEARRIAANIAKLPKLLGKEG